MNFVQFISTKTFWKNMAYSILIVLAMGWIILMLLKVYTRHNQVVETPSLLKMNMEQIKDLGKLGDLQPIVVDSLYDNTRIPGTVISQDPAPGTRVKPNRAIYLTLVSFVPEQVNMPALVDLSLRQAKALLQTYNLKLGSVYIIPDVPDNTIIKATVNGQMIKPGTLVRKGAVVDLYAGEGTKYAQPMVPFLIGKSRREAIAEITRLGFYVSSEDFGGVTDTASLRVYDQFPPYIYGKKVASGTAFSLIYKSDLSFDFNDYIKNLTIDTVKPQTPVQ